MIGAEMVKFGLFYLFSDFGNITQERIFSEVLEEIDFGEKLGFDSVWLPEHHSSVYGTLGNPMTFAAAVSQRTKRMLIDTVVMVPPFQHPLRLAEDAALVDALSGGRLLLGIGRGYQAPEFEVFGIPQNASRAMFLESLDIMIKAWTEDTFSYDGNFWKIKNASVYPKPVQKPHPPIYWAAISPATYEVAGLRGFPILRGPNFTSISSVEEAYAGYTARLRENGHDPDQLDLPFSLKVYVAPTDAEAKAEMHHALWFYHTLAKFATRGAGPADPGGVRAVSSRPVVPGRPHRGPAVGCRRGLGIRDCFRVTGAGHRAAPFLLEPHPHQPLDALVQDRGVGAREGDEVHGPVRPGGNARAPGGAGENLAPGFPDAKATLIAQQENLLQGCSDYLQTRFCTTWRD